MSIAREAAHCLTSSTDLDGFVTYAWNGTPLLGHLDDLGETRLSGQLSYRGEVFDTDCWCGYGLWAHLAEEKIERFCRAIDAREKAVAA